MAASARLCLVLLAAASAAMPQRLSFGLKGGVPITDALKVTDRSRYFSDRAPYVIGPAVELHLIGGLSGEADLFYRRLEYGETTQGATTSRTTGQIWEIPVLAKFRAPGAVARPTLAAGISLRRPAQFQQRASSGQSTGLSGGFSAGATLGGGVELSLPLVRLSAELRYTRWGSSSLRSALGGLVSQLNQADMLLGIMF